MFGKSSNTRKLESFSKLAIARINILKKQHAVRCSVARSDVVQLLNLGRQDQALVRVEQVIKEQNMVDVLDMVEKYCFFLIRRLSLIKCDSECPEELNDAISSLIFAASRCGELPELQEIRVIFDSIYGKEFANDAVELRNGCKVNPKIVKKLSTRRPSSESRQDWLKQIASLNGIECVLEKENEKVVKDKKQKEKQIQSHEAANLKDPTTSIETRLSLSEVQSISESIKARLCIRNGNEYAR